MSVYICATKNRRANINKSFYDFLILTELDDLIVKGKKFQSLGAWTANAQSHFKLGPGNIMCK